MKMCVSGAYTPWIKRSGAFICRSTEFNTYLSLLSVEKGINSSTSTLSFLQQSQQSCTASTMAVINILLIAALSSFVLANFPGDPFSYYIGAPMTATFTGPPASTSYLSSMLDNCSGYLSGIQDLATYTTTNNVLDTAVAMNVCGFCTSLSQSRVESCCANPESTEWANCFESAARGGKAQATTAHKSATTTPASNSATVTGVAAAASATKSSNGSKFRMVSSIDSVYP
jgi:hypothetical protein